MMLDSDDYVGVAHPSEKDQIAIINTDTPDAEVDQLQDLPTADDCTLHRTTSYPSIPSSSNPLSPHPLRPTPLQHRIVSGH